MTLLKRLNNHLSNRLHHIIKVVILLAFMLPIVLWIGKIAATASDEVKAHQTIITKLHNTTAVDKGHGSIIASTDSDITYGIDVSYFQGTINWSALKKDTLDFVIVKATGGNTYIDPQFHTNWNSLRENQLIRGAYHFFYADDDPKSQAKHYLNTVGLLKSTDLPPILDVEITDHQTADILLTRVLEWLETVEQATKRRPILGRRN
jgi:GH25 family lysozyme M1 (1,4-beta-N-acetylmuramidase)